MAPPELPISLSSDFVAGDIDGTQGPRDSLPASRPSLAACTSPASRTHGSSPQPVIDTRPHQKKAMLTKMNRTLLKCIAALCALASVGAVPLPLSPSLGCVSMDIQWSCFQECHAFGGAWPNYNPNHPDVIKCKLGCGTLCPMPPTPPSPSPPPLPCQDENTPTDPEYCQNEVGSFIDKITKCKQDSYIAACEQTCGFCPPA